MLLIHLGFNMNKSLNQEVCLSLSHTQNLSFSPFGPLQTEKKDSPTLSGISNDINN